MKENMKYIILGIVVVGFMVLFANLHIQINSRPNYANADSWELVSSTPDEFVYKFDDGGIRCYTISSSTGGAGISCIPKNLINP